MQTVIRGWSATTVGELDISVQAMVTSRASSPTAGKCRCEKYCALHDWLTDVACKMHAAILLSAYTMQSLQCMGICR